MCFGPGDGERHKSKKKRPNENRRTIKRLTELRYRTDETVMGRNPLSPSELITFTTLKNTGNRVMGVMAPTTDGFLVVSHVYTNRDERSSNERPLASDILLSFWKHVAKQPRTAIGTEFDYVYDNCKLARCVKSMVTEYIEMKDVGAGVRSIDFVPQDRRGRNFHLVVMIGHARSARHA
ncbi:hypothetical protein KVR01_009045 [Diaporthe batatas]|uniref:uncharacterized protein n=1 Tax=Diaporthe batatas TaxID=748121 RepID=UPI001D049DC0|nr:uncharacterized protein KVR01_009045 [Diaporthe batatas]KAG8160781.1 hypothetical protein KVR01_009045 [Diaporthe batatas]